MGLLVEGNWQDRWYDTSKSGGRFERSRSAFRNWITRDGSAGATGDAGFKAEAGRYHLYVSLACPWAHRTLIYRRLKGLEQAIGLSIVDWFMGDNGWTFRRRDGATGDGENGTEFLWQIYALAKSDYSGRVTVPVLWDRHRKTIVNNESSEIIRMFDLAFDAAVPAAGATPELYPAGLREAIDAINARVYASVNNGVYRCGFATTQEAYDEAFSDLFETLDWLDGILGKQRYVCGNAITEADWRLFTTLVRFDVVYFGHFKCNLRRIDDYANLSGYLRDLYQVPGISQTVDFHHIKQHYYASHETINPHRIVPRGPAVDYMQPHGRDNPRRP